MSSGPSWKDSDHWSDLVSGRVCPLCRLGGGPGEIAAELTSCHVLTDRTVNVRGYCCLILKRHAIELHQLTPAEGAAFMLDVQRVARAVQELTGAIKLNYEVHGNVIPHVHLHIVPRYPGDAIETRGLGFAKIAESPWSPGEFESFTTALRARLAD